MSEDERTPLTRARVLDEALAMADEQGLGSMSMRGLGKRLGVEGMALYNHVANKDAILDGIVERVLEEIPHLDPAGDWVAEMRHRATTARQVFLRHTWAVGLIEARYAESSPTRLRYFDSVLGCLRNAGFDPMTAMRAFSIVDSFVYGFVLQEISLPFDDSESLQEVGDDLLQQMAEAYPHLTEATTVAMREGWDYDEQFEFGLDLVLDALDRTRSG